MDPFGDLPAVQKANSGGDCVRSDDPERYLKDIILSSNGTATSGQDTVKRSSLKPSSLLRRKRPLEIVEGTAHQETPESTPWKEMRLAADTPVVEEQPCVRVVSPPPATNADKIIADAEWYYDVDDEYDPHIPNNYELNLEENKISQAQQAVLSKSRIQVQVQENLRKQVEEKSKEAMMSNLLQDPSAALKSAGRGRIMAMPHWMARKLRVQEDQKSSLSQIGGAQVLEHPSEHVDDS